MRSLSFFCQRREGSPGEEKVLRHRQTDCLHLAWISLSLTPLCPPCTAHPNGIIMTSSGVNREVGRGLIQTKVLYASVGVGSSDRCLCCNYQLSCLFPNSPSTPPPIPCPIPFSFINSNPPHPLLATIFFLVWMCLLPPSCSRKSCSSSFKVFWEWIRDGSRWLRADSCHL